MHHFKADGGNTTLEVLRLLSTIPLILSFLYLFNDFIIDFLIKITGHDREVLFLLVLSIALTFSALMASDFFGLSLEIGAL
ncbi:MAG: hypothetical protein Q9M91_03595 [Candidatus Dojkabacteria bacterium]|nr:hypothetical protein [Candidatus Dojkabacteria bacterium]